MIVSPTERPVKNTTKPTTDLYLRPEALIATGLFLLGALSRLPFVGEILYHWDSINFALSLRRFDVAAGQPHAPGYILYVFLGQLINVIVDDPQLTLAGISVVSSGLAVACLYGLGRTMFNQEIGLLGALLLASSPLFWFYGAIALPHSLDALVVIVAVWLLYLIQQGQLSLAVPAALWLAIAGGLRPQTEIFLAPLTLYTGWRLGWRRGLMALGVLAVSSLAWLIPLLWLSGGPARYFEMMGEFYAAFNDTTSVLNGAGLFGLTRNSIKLTLYTLYGWGLALAPVLIWIGVKFKRLTGTFDLIFEDTRFWMMALWVCPPIAYYIFVHMGQQGLVFVFLPALLLLSAAAFYNLNWSLLILRQLTLVGLVMVNGLIFMYAPTYPLGGNRLKLLSADTLRRHDAYYLPRLEAMRQNFPKTRTLILSSEWRFPQYYLPHYLLAPFGIVPRWELAEGTPTRAGEVWVNGMEAGLIPDEEGFFYVVLFDDNLIPFNQSPERQEWLQLAEGQKLVYMRFTPAERFYIAPQAYRIISASQ